MKFTFAGKVGCVVTAIFAITYGNASWADVIDFQQGLDGYAGSEDVHLHSAAPTGNFGGRTDAYVAGSAGQEISYLLRFEDLILDPNFEIDTAVVRLVFDTAGGPITASLSVSPLLRDWVEGTGTGAAGPGATWSVDGLGNSWDAPGATGAVDKDAVQSTVPGVTINNPFWFEWELDVALVQSWIDNPAANYGLIFQSNNGQAARIHSTEGPTTAWRPVLRLTGQVVPEPSSVALLCVAGITMIASRRRNAF